MFHVTNPGQKLPLASPPTLLLSFRASTTIIRAPFAPIALCGPRGRGGASFLSIFFGGNIHWLAQSLLLGHPLSPSHTLSPPSRGSNTSGRAMFLFVPLLYTQPSQQQWGEAEYTTKLWGDYQNLYSIKFKHGGGTPARMPGRKPLLAGRTPS